MFKAHFVSTEERRAPFAVRLAAGLYWAWYSYRARRAQRLTVQILQSLDHRTLKDIGVDPSEIESTVYSVPGERIRQYGSNWC